MTQILLTSSILIGVTGLLRLILRRWVSKRLIYATWLLVALRLLIPFQFGQSEYSVAAVAEKLEQRSAPIQQVQQQLQKPMSGPSQEEIYQKLMADYLSQSQPQTTPTQTPQPEPDIAPSVTVPPEVHQQLSQQAEDQISAPTLAQLLTSIWIGGIILMAGWFLLSNAIFLRRARRAAQPCGDITAPIPVRISGNVTTPCLAGLFRPVIYLTPASAADPQIRHHVLTHELTHLRHLDHVWAWVRCLCLCIYWFHPLVWIAAMVSKRDCELACDEAALKKLGDHQRIAYGKTLLATVTHSPTHVFHAATAMSETKKQLKERVNFIVKKPKNLWIAAICLILAVTLTAGLVFTGCKSQSKPTTPTTSAKSPAPVAPDASISTPDMPTQDDLLNLLHKSAKMVEENDTIVLESHWGVDYYLSFHNLPPEVMTISDDTITIKTKIDHFGPGTTEDMVYAAFLSQLAELYPDDLTPMDIHYNPYMGRGPFYNAFFYTGWDIAGYNSIEDYYAAIVAGEEKTPQNAFKIGYQYPSIKPANSAFSDDDIYDIFLSQINQAATPSPMPTPDTAVVTTAQELIDYYMWYWATDVCCDLEPVTVGDMSQYLTEQQKEFYHGQQRRITCCHTADEVLAHIDQVLDKSLQRADPIQKLFSDGKALYVITSPTEYRSFSGVQIIDYSDSHITATAKNFDEDGIYAVAQFHIDLTGNGARITDVQFTDVPPCNHDYEVTTIPPYDTEGYDLHTCKKCGYWYKDNFTEQVLYID